MPSANDQRLRATQMAQDGIQQLLEAGISFKRVAEAYSAAAVKLVLQHADIDDAQDLLVSLHMMLDKHAETQRHGRTVILGRDDARQALATRDLELRDGLRLFLCDWGAAL